MSYEKSLIRLEEIINKLASGNISLEDSLTLFSEGAKLIEQCNKQLTDAKLKVEKLTLTKEVQ